MYLNLKKFISVDFLKILKKLKTSKSAGYHSIPASLVKEGAVEIVTSLLHLLNSSPRESVSPTSEKCAKITPVQVKGHQ